MRNFKEIIINLEKVKRNLILAKEAAKGKYTSEVAYFEKREAYLNSLLKLYGGRTIFKVTMWGKEYLLTDFDQPHEVEEFAYIVWGIKPSKIELVPSGFDSPLSP